MNMKRHIRSDISFTLRIGLYFVLLGMGFPSTAFGQGDLMVFPKRIVFDGSTRTINLNVANTGNDTARYALSFLQYRMSENGKFEEITTPDSGQFFADPFLRLFPRSVVIPPKVSQIVKIQLTKISELQPGEYRSHLYLRSIPKPVPLGEANTPTDSGIAIRITPVYGLTIPVIIRKGPSDTQLTLSDAYFINQTDSTAELSLALNRTGNMSVYGTLVVNHLAPDGVAQQVGYVQGLAVYTPNSLRRFVVPLEKKGTDFNTGKLHLEFSEEVNFKPVKRAELDINLP